VSVALTHKAYSFLVQPWPQMSVVSGHVLGVLDAAGHFQPFLSSYREVRWPPVDVEAVYLNGHFTAEDVIRKHEELIARQTQGELGHGVV
jgi:hypothetical protein